MPNAIVQAEIRSSDPDATRGFFGELFGWTQRRRGWAVAWSSSRCGCLGSRSA